MSRSFHREKQATSCLSEFSGSWKSRDFFRVCRVIRVSILKVALIFQAVQSFGEVSQLTIEEVGENKRLTSSEALRFLLDRFNIRAFWFFIF